MELNTKALGRKLPEALINELQSYYRQQSDDYGLGYNAAVHDIIQMIENCTRKEKGHWIENDGWDGDVYYECSVCKEAFCMIDGTPVENMYYYCPHCGAAMAGEIERREE